VLRATKESDYQKGSLAFIARVSFECICWVTQILAIPKLDKNALWDKKRFSEITIGAKIPR
jgi:hypothetical protein